MRCRRVVFWLLGLGLLVGTAAGAGLVLHQPPADSPPVSEGATGTGVICIGFVDVAPGIAHLTALQTGRVVKVISEGAQVSREEVLVQLDDRLAQEEVKQAEAALQAARVQLAKAKQLVEQHSYLLAELRQAVEATRQEKIRAEKELELKKRAVQNQLLRPEEQEAAQAQVHKLHALWQAAQAKLAAAERTQPEREVELAQLEVTAKEAQLAKARLALETYQIRAPAEGEVLRVLTSVGEVLSPLRGAAIEFCPKLPRIVRAEVQQEWAARVRLGQEVVIEDDSAAGLRWRGRVKHLSDWYTHRRFILQEPFQMNDVRTIECLVDILDEGPHRPRIGQRMRVIIQE
jgi:HlyD family secretion protein